MKREWLVSAWIGYVAAFVTLALPGIAIEGCSVRNRIRNEAIEAGAGEWRIDAKTGEKSFHWIGSKGDG